MEVNKVVSTLIFFVLCAFCAFLACEQALHLGESREVTQEVTHRRLLTLMRR